MSKLPENKKRLSLLICGALLLLAVVLMFCVSLRNRKVAQRWNIHSYTVIAEIDGVIENTLVATRYARRYFLTGDGTFRQAARVSLQSSSSRLRHVQNLTRDNATQQKILRRTSRMAARVENDLKEVLSRPASTRKTPIVSNPVDATAISQRIEALIASLQSVKGTERNLLEQRKARANLVQFQSDFLLSTLALALLLFIGTLILQILRDSRIANEHNAQLRRETVERENAQCELRASHQTLEERVRRRTRELEQLNAGLLQQIREREQAEAALRHSEQRYHSLVETTSQIIWTTSPEGLVEDMPTWCDFTGQNMKEVMGFGWLDAVHPDDREKASQAWLDAVRRKAFYLVEYRIRRHDGEYRRFLSRGIPVVEGGNILEWVGTCTDIEDERRASDELQRARDELEERVEERTAALERANAALEKEIAERLGIAEALRRSEEEYRLLVENSNDLIFKADASGRFAFFNARMIRVTGFSAEELRGRHFTALVPREYRAATRRFFADQRRQQMIDTTYEFPVRTKSGATIWLEQNTHLSKSSDGSLVFQGAARDITERVKAQDELRESEERFKRLADGTFEAVAVTYRDRIADANAKFLDMFGYSMDQVRAMKATEFITPETRHKVVEALETNREEPYEATGLRSDGSEMFLEICGKAIPYHGGQARITSLRDITQRKAVDRMKNEFISTVSHELRTPLTSIRGALGLMKGGAAGALPERAQSMTQIAYHNSERLIRLINAILDIEKLESGKMVLQLGALDLGESVAGALESNRAYGEELGVRFELRIAAASTRAEKFTVLADADRLAQVLTNLLGNAAKFSAHGRTEIAPIQVVLERVGEAGEEWYRVSICDGGPGIAESFRARVFGRFAQGDSSDARPVGGTGLGLNISKTIIEKLGGRIGFYNNDERAAGAAGATFYFELPALDEAALKSTCEYSQSAE